MNESLQQFDKALTRLEEVLQRSAEHDTIILDATIQHFEFSIEKIYLRIPEYAREMRKLCDFLHSDHS